MPAPESAVVTIKVPFSEVGLRVLHRLAPRGVKTNLTCLMAFNQAYLAALAGATYVSVFSGRIRDMGHDSGPVIEATRQAIQRENRQASRLDPQDARQIDRLTPPVRRDLRRPRAEGG